MLFYQRYVGRRVVATSVTFINYINVFPHLLFALKSLNILQYYVNMLIIISVHHNVLKVSVIVSISLNMLCVSLQRMRDELREHFCDNILPPSRYSGKQNFNLVEVVL